MRDFSNLVLDLDATPEVPVKIGGRDFKIVQQRRAILERILRFVNDDLAEAAKEGEGTPEAQPFTDALFANWDKALPTLALILGAETEVDIQELVAHLKDHLKPTGAFKLFETWWALNDCDSFFDRGGKPALHPEVVEARRLVSRRMAQEYEESVLAGDSVLDAVEKAS